jgi:hypothetical protein
MLINELLAKAHQKESLRKVAYNHLVIQARHGSGGWKYSYGRALAWLGSRLCKLGNLLQERSGDVGTRTSYQVVKSSFKV